MSGLLGFLSTLISFAYLLFQEYLKRSDAATQAQQKYQVDQSEFESLASAVLTRLRLQTAKDSSDSQEMEKKADDSLAQREKNP
jgi:hypothetical protein